MPGARVLVDGRVVRLTTEALGLGVVERDGMLLPADGDRVLGPEDWAAWCEQNGERIRAAAGARPGRKRAKGQAELFSEKCAL